MRVDPARLADLLARARREIDQGLLPSCQVAVARDGELVTFEAFGEATTSTRYVVFSCTKALVASAVWFLVGEGLEPTTRVAEVIPEFATNGKDEVTVEQVMLHTSGFPRAPMPPSTWNDREARIERFSRWRLNWEPGSRYEYHATSAHWVLAELIHRCTGEDHRAFVRNRVTDPLGLPPMLGLGQHGQADIATVVPTGEPPTSDELEAALGVRSLPLGEVTDHALVQLNEPDARRAGVPGAGAVGTAADLALFYQALLHNPGPLWPPAVLHDATTNVRTRLLDPMTGVPSNRSLGLVIAGDDGKAFMRHNFGRTVSPTAFGHSGAGGQIAWADPATGISFSYLTNGLDAHVLREGRRGLGLSSRAGALTAR